MPPKRKAAAAAAAATTTTAPKKAAASKRKAKKDEEEEIEEEEEEVVVKAPPAKKKAAPKKKAAAAKEDDEEEEEEEEKKTVSVTVKGHAAVDAHVAGGATKHVFEEGKVVWNALLNQTNIGNNNNKFYVIQLLKDDSGPNYYCFTRWARVGLVGQMNLDQFNNLPMAKKAFEKKFHDKTKNSWADICAGKEFKTVSGKYTLIEIDYSADADAADEPAPKKARKGAAAGGGDDDDDDGAAGGGGGGGLKRANSSKLPPPVQKLIELIFDLKMMETQMTELEYDVKKQPLGRLSKNTIKQGFQVLKDLEEVINGTADGDVVELSNRFYTLIPHVFGMQRPPAIRTLDQVRKKLQMIEALADIEVATSISKTTKGAGSVIDANYEKLNCHITPVPRTSDEFKTIDEYVKNTFVGQKPPKIVEVFAIERDGEVKRFADKGAKIGNRKLLWHGSRLTNFAGILSQGLRIAPPEAPVSGYRFGKGIYMASIASLSANYCRTYGTPNFCMLLADAALGKPAEVLSDQYMEKPLPKTDSTLAVGTLQGSATPKKLDLRAPVLPSNKVSIDHKVDVPCGKPVSKSISCSCYEEQFVVYDVAQVKLQYLVWFEQA